VVSTAYRSALEGASYIMVSLTATAAVSVAVAGAGAAFAAARRADLLGSDIS
jgi:hypothetical protein